ncbi:unnamed protein product [Orchesella dallaii]|uniref:ferroxidase n=1 Tax=Orchesella dallaii TaxID=48710 RepID=A0ABP1QEA2_9HEXA
MWQRHIHMNVKILKNICSPPSSHFLRLTHGYCDQISSSSHKPGLSSEFGNGNSLRFTLNSPSAKTCDFLGTFVVQRRRLSLSKHVDIGNRYFHIDQTNSFYASTIPASANKTEQLEPTNLSKNEYEEIAEDTLESLTGYFDEIIERSTLAEADVSYGSGVLTIKLGPPHGTYVINKQTPNKQIWLSSPSSGPKRYDFINKTWIYRHDGMSLYQLLNSEIPDILKSRDVDFVSHCTYGKAVCK